MPKMRLNILREFGYKSRTLTFKLSQIEDIFEVKVPRLQILRGKNVKESTETLQPRSKHDPSQEMMHVEDARRELRTEIRRWWQGLSDHMDKLVSAVGSLLLNEHYKRTT